MKIFVALTLLVGVALLVMGKTTYGHQLQRLPDYVLFLRYYHPLGRLPLAPGAHMNGAAAFCLANLPSAMPLTSHCCASLARVQDPLIQSIVCKQCSSAAAPPPPPPPPPPPDSA